MDVVRKIEENSRLMDLMLDDLNVNRGLVQKNLARMSNRPDRMVVQFRELHAKNNVFHLEFGKHDPYKDLVRRVANKLDVVPARIRLRSHMCGFNKPDSNHIKYHFNFNGCLWGTTENLDKICNVFYYEVIDEPLPENWKNVKVTYGYPYSIQMSVALRKRDRVKHLLKHKDVLELTNSNGQLRLVGIYNYKIYRVFPPEEKIDNIPECVKLRVEEIPEDLGQGHHEIHVHHFTKTDYGEISEFGKPFLFAIRDNETLAEIKVRIQEKLSVGNEEFSKWKFAVLLLGRPKYLKDTDVVSNCFEAKDDGLEQCLGLDHPTEYYEGHPFTLDADMVEDILCGW